jgi:hypothetical protein
MVPALMREEASGNSQPLDLARNTIQSNVYRSCPAPKRDAKYTNLNYRDPRLIA